MKGAAHKSRNYIFDLTSFWVGLLIVSAIQRFGEIEGDTNFKKMCLIAKGKWENLIEF